MTPKKPLGFFTDAGKRKPITGRISGFGNSETENGARKHLLKEKKRVDPDQFRKKQIREAVLSIEKEFREIRGSDSKLKQAQGVLNKAYRIAWGKKRPMGGRGKASKRGNSKAENKARKETIQSRNYDHGDYTGPNPTSRSIKLDRARHSKHQPWENR